MQFRLEYMSMVYLTVSICWKGTEKVDMAPLFKEVYSERSLAEYPCVDTTARQVKGIKWRSPLRWGYRRAG